MSNVFQVAKYIIEKMGPVTTMKLQKLVYYCQAWSLAWDDKPLFEDDFEAWANGPVAPALFNRHRGKFVANNELFKDIDITDSFDKDSIETMDAVIRDYGDKSPQWLSELTHSEAPWIEARKGCSPGEYCSAVIDKESMRQYYGGL